MAKRDDLARFATESRLDDLPGEEREHLKVLVLDALGCALGTLGVGPLPAIRAHVEALGGPGRATLVGGGSAPLDRAAQHNTALTRYLDFMDGFAGPGGGCHPSDNLAGVLAACEQSDGSGRDFLAALAVAYETECRLVELAPVMDEGFDHTTQLAVSAACGMARALGLDEKQTAEAISIAGTAHASIRVDRTGKLSNWKGLASSDVAVGAAHAVLLARRGVTGPAEVFEGKFGYEEVLSEKRVDLGWVLGKDDRIPRIFLKRYNAEMHTQPGIEAILELREREGIDPDDVDEVEIETFRSAYEITGGKQTAAYEVETKDQADHSYPYLVAVALLDGDVQPAQLEPARIRRDDVQALLKRVTVKKSWMATRKHPDRFEAKVTVRMKDGKERAIEKEDWDGFHTRPWTFDRALDKFDRLAARSVDDATREEIARVVRRLEDHPIDALTKLLAKARVRLGPEDAPSPAGRRPA